MTKGDRWAEDLHRVVGENISRIRKGRTPKPLTQNELAERTNGRVSRSSIANIERGLQHISVAQLYLMAAALDVEVTELLPSRQSVFGIDADRLDRAKAQKNKPISDKDWAWIEKAAIAKPVKRQEN